MENPGHIDRRVSSQSLLNYTNKFCQKHLPTTDYKRKNARKYCYLVHDFMLYLYRNKGVFIQLMQRAEMWRIGF